MIPVKRLGVLNSAQKKSMLFLLDIRRKDVIILWMNPC